MWEGKRADGTVITEEDLKRILADHNEWVECYYAGRQEESACLSYNKANLSGADLSGANLSGANLSHADLNQATLYEVNLSGATSVKVNLSGANLSKVSLSKAMLWGADLSGANLNKADLSQAVLYKANLSKAMLLEADLSGVFLGEADLSQAMLYYANLSGANLMRTNLAFSSLLYSDLKDTKLWGSNISSVTYETKPGALPFVPDIATIKGLETLTYKDSPHALMELREAAKKAGMRDQERQITTAIKRRDNEIRWNGTDPLQWAESGLNYVFFDLTSGYGLYPGRPLRIMLYGILFLSFPYTLSIIFKIGEGGIWKVWQTDRVGKNLGSEEPERLCLYGQYETLPDKFLRRLKMRIGRLIRAFEYGLYFSLISAFTIGWRDLNVGNWISRIQGREYILKSTRWVRTISGLQSIVSAYLLALAVLCYFGRPFE